MPHADKYRKIDLNEWYYGINCALTLLLVPEMEYFMRSI